MKKEQVLSRLKEDCLVAVVRAKNLEQGEKVVDAIIAGGINFIEITMTMDEGNPVEFIAAMAKKYKDNDKIVIGAGTVLDPETARQVILAGANYVVSPGLNVETIKLCNRYRVPMLPGVMTPSEAITAMEAGCDIIKVFPGNIVGPAAISSFKGPLPQGEFMPSGGVDVDNVDKWIHAGAYAVGTGSSLTKGIKVTVNNGNSIELDFHIIVSYGVSIQTVTDNLIHNVSYKVKELTGLNIDKIRVYVEGVRVID